MPASVVKTAEGETHWSKAKEAAKKSKVKVGSDRYWKIVTKIWKSMGGNSSEK